MAGTSYQFVHLEAFRRGPASGRGTLGSIVAEGLRKPTHISHLPGAPRCEVVHLDGPVSDPEDLSSWIEGEMASAKNTMMMRGRSVERAVRKDALAIGTMIASLPETLADYDERRFSDFAEDTTEWARDFLAARDCVLHFRLEHLDELHPHIHLWFTPKGAEEREGNWSFSSVFGKSKGFLHQFQVGFFDSVGHKYFDARARPMEDREKRLPRHYAIKKRDAEDREVVNQIRDGSLSLLNAGFTPDNLDLALSRLDDSDLDALPSVSRRLVSLNDENTSLVERHVSEKKSLEDQLARLREDNEKLQQRAERAESHPPQSASHISALEKERGLFYRGASEFLSKGVWDRVVKNVLAAAYQNMNRAHHVPVDEWVELVIEDALPRIAPEIDTYSLDDIEYWTAQATLALRQSGIHQVGEKPFEAFADNSNPSVEPSVADVSSKPQRFRSVASGDDGPAKNPWGSIGR